MKLTFASVALALTVGGLYGVHVSSAPFVYEDWRNVVQLNRPFHTQGLRQGRGLSTESWTAIRTPRASHALNLGLHLLVVLLTGLLVWQMAGNSLMAFSAAAILAVHPVTVEGVAYAANRAELLSAVGVLLALVCVGSSWVWPWVFVPAAGGLAYGGKETGIVVVGLIPLVLWMRGDRQWASRWAVMLIGVIVPALLLVPNLLRAIAHMAVGTYTEMSWLQWASTQAVATWRLVVLSVAPFWLSVAPDVLAASSLTRSAAVILLVALGECAWRLRKVAPLATCGLVGIAIVLVPRFLVRTPWSPLNEHQWYLAMPFVACVLTAGLHAISRGLTWLSPEPFLMNHADPL